VLGSAAAAAACAVLVITASVAYAGPEPPSGGDCPNGYFAAQANKSYVGAAVPGGQRVGSFPIQNEIIGLVCFKRFSPTHGTLQFRWSAVGPLDEGIFYYQLYDCTARTVAEQHSKTLEYPTGSKAATSGQASAEFALDPKHKYAARVTGQGAYERAHESLAGSVGYFANYPRVPGYGPTAPEFFDQSTCQ
jgi:hypothetical protein